MANYKSFDKDMMRLITFGANEKNVNISKFRNFCHEVKPFRCEINNANLM